MKQLIVNADDFGLTTGVTQGILDAHWEGIVTSTTVLANGAAFDLAVSASRTAPGLGVGVHLNLSEGVPVSPARRIPTLVNQQGRLHLTPGHLLRSMLSGSASLDEVEAELRAQIMKVVRAGISPTHLDGHKHVHVLPGIDDIVIRLAREFDILSLRCPLERPSGLLKTVRAAKGGGPSILRQFVVARGVSAFGRRFRQKLDVAGLQYPEHFYGLTQTGFLNTRLIRHLVDSLPEGTSELMCHPGYPDTSLAQTGTRLLSEREVEVFALCSPPLRTLIADSGIGLISYQALTANSSLRRWQLEVLEDSRAGQGERCPVSAGGLLP
jgi:chitin disaccharide deacetylase